MKCLQFEVICVWFCVAMTSEYAATRKQFNKSLSEFGMIQVRSEQSALQFDSRKNNLVNEVCVLIVTVGEVRTDGY